MSLSAVFDVFTVANALTYSSLCYIMFVAGVRSRFFVFAGEFMRNLTIKRQKSSFGSLTKAKFYIEDVESADVIVNGTPCRKLGELKNGDEATFEIDDRAARLFAFTEKRGENIFNDFLSLPEGSDDLSVSGKNLRDEIDGFAFRFDTNEGGTLPENPARGAKKAVIVVVAAVAALLLAAGCFVGYKLWVNRERVPQPKTFSSNGLTITLTDEFTLAKNEHYTFIFDSEAIDIPVLKENFSTLSEGFAEKTLDEYIDILLEVNKLPALEKRHEDGLVYYEYTLRNSDDPTLAYHFTNYVYKSDDAFWLVQFIVNERNIERFSNQITEFAKSVTFSTTEDS